MGQENEAHSAAGSTAPCKLAPLPSWLDVCATLGDNLFSLSAGQARTGLAAHVTREGGRCPHRHWHYADGRPLRAGESP